MIVTRVKSLVVRKIQLAYLMMLYGFGFMGHTFDKISCF